MTNNFQSPLQLTTNPLKCRLVAAQKKVKALVILLTYWLIFAAE